MVRVQRPDDGLWMFDVEQFGSAGYAAVYLVSGEQPALVETGTSLEAPQVLAGLRQAKLPPEEVRWIFVTHVHLDHAGGAGTLLAHMPQAQVAVHPRGARHLQDPRRLLASVKEATGEMADEYGTAEPIPQDRIALADDGQVFHLGERRLQAVHTPGHAPHHVCFFEQEGGWLFTGDAAGIYRNGELLPTTPPPSFDLAATLSSLDRLAGLNPQVLLYTHFGPSCDARGMLMKYRHTVADWVKRVEQVWLETGRDEEATTKELLHDPQLRGWPYNDRAPQAELEMCVRGAVGHVRRREAEGE